MEIDFIKALVSVDSIIIGFLTATLIALFTMKESELLTLINVIENDQFKLKKYLNRFELIDIDSYNKWMTFFQLKRTNPKDINQGTNSVISSNDIFLGKSEDYEDLKEKILSEYDKVNNEYLINSFIIVESLNNANVSIKDLINAKESIHYKTKKKEQIINTFHGIKFWLIFSLFAFTTGVIYPLSLFSDDPIKISFLPTDILNFLISIRGLILISMFLVYSSFIIYLICRYQKLRKLSDISDSAIKKLLETLNTNYYGKYF